MHFQPGNLVNARERVWVVQSDSTDEWLLLRPLDGADDEITKLIPALEVSPIETATFEQPDPSKIGSFDSAPLFYNALRFQLRSGAGPFRSFGSINFEPRSYQFVPLLMAMRQETVRLLIADDVGVGKTIESGLIIRELIDRGEIQSFAVLCPASLVEQWCEELLYHFNIKATALTASNAQAIERSIPHSHKITEHYPYLVVSLDYIKSDLHRDYFEKTPLDLILVDEAHTCVRSSSFSSSSSSPFTSNAAKADLSARGKDNKQKRFDLLQKLTGDPQRHIHVLLLTATPHSGNDEAFLNLLSLLDERFLKLDLNDKKSPLRNELAQHFIQRRRKDIQEWKEQDNERITGFPRRFTAEVKYKLNDDWRRFIDQLLEYCVDFILHGEGHDKLALKSTAFYEIIALLRCVASSPDAACTTLKNRINKINKAIAEQTGGSTAPASASSDAASSSVQVQVDAADDAEADDDDDDFDYSAKSMLSQDFSDDTTREMSDQAPSLALALNDSHQLKQLVALCTKFSGIDNDPKLRTVIVLVKELLEQGYHPVIFCRFIDTAKYVTKYLKQVLVPENGEQKAGTRKKTKQSAAKTASKSKAQTITMADDSDLATVVANTSKIADLQVDCVTGENVPEERKDKVEKLMQSPKRILVATDCLSEGINLQQGFTAVVHYDLSWNPNRHEQREGRVDRFGQSEKEVRCAMIYSEDNPIDQQIMTVIKNKSQKIKDALGVYVSVPEQVESVGKNIILEILEKYKAKTYGSFIKELEQEEFLKSFTTKDPATTTIENGQTITVGTQDSQAQLFSQNIAPTWNDFLKEANKSKTIFAQGRISPQDIQPYWEQQQNYLGSFHDVWDFLTQGYAVFGCHLQPQEKSAHRNSTSSVLKLQWHSNDESNPSEDEQKQLPFTKFSFPVEQTSADDGSLQISLYDEGFKENQLLNVEQVHRAAPMVSLLAANLIDRILSDSDSRLKRCGIAISDQVQMVTTIYLLRLRYQMHLQDKKKDNQRQLMVEEIMPIMAQGINKVIWDHSDQVINLLFNSHSSGNFAQAMAQKQISKSLELINRPESQQQLEQLAKERAYLLEQEHNNMRKYSAEKLSTTVQPCFPVDILGVYVLLPDTD